MFSDAFSETWRKSAQAFILSNICKGELSCLLLNARRCVLGRHDRGNKGLDFKATNKRPARSVLPVL